MLNVLYTHCYKSDNERKYQYQSNMVYVKMTIAYINPLLVG